MTEGVLWAGERAFLLEFGSLAEVVAFHRDVTDKPLPGQREAVAAARTVLLDFRTRRDAVAAARQARRRRPKPAADPQARQIELSVHYGGEDLASVAQLLDMSEDALIAWHTSTVWVAAFGGFAPGFTYCVPEELTRRRRPRRSEAGLEVPRLDSPRQRVPAGAVGLAGEFSGVYPRSSPGGWQLIGSTDAELWHAERSEPALIRPGDRVRYTARAESITVSEPPSFAAAAKNGGADALEVISPGAQTLVQDTGRIGFSDLGVPRSGAADLAAARQANQLVGNDDAAAVFEVLHGGFELAAKQTLVLAVTGAETALEVTSPAAEQTSNMAVNGTGAAVSADSSGAVREVPARAPFWLFPGERLTLAAPSRGVRCYVAVSGGLEAPQILGSSAADTLSGLGPAPVRAGESFGLLGATSRFVGIADVARTALPDPDEVTTLRFVPGPREDWFTRAKGRRSGFQQLESSQWSVSQRCDRVGIRLETDDDAGYLQRSRDHELKSEPMVRGAIQVPPSGEPVVLLADHPVTGGYPVLGVVVRADLGLAAQLAPGAEVRFTAVDPETLTPVS